MREPLRWADAEGAEAWLMGREACAEILRLLARLPLLDVAVLRQLLGLCGAASVYRSVARLEGAGLIAAIRPPVYRGCSPRLLYPTDLGLATLALDQGFEPGDMARRLRLRGRDLLALAPRLPDLLATYELLGALAASPPGRPRLLAWERPWRRSYPRPLARTPACVALPAHAVLAWEGEVGSYLLLPDRGIIPPHLQRPALDRLLLLRRSRDGDLPTLVIATTSRERMGVWGRLLEELAKARRDAPLDARVARWDDLGRDLAGLPVADGEGESAHLHRPILLPPLHPRRPSARLPRIVGDTLTTPARSRPDDDIGRLALEITPTDHDLLELVGFHPFLSPAQLADVLDWEVASVRRRTNRLMRFGLMRLLLEDEIGMEAVRERMELTTNGLELVAAHLGLSLAITVRELGLTGGGPDQPAGPRRKLLRTLSHTLEADEVFVHLYRIARQVRIDGSDDAVEEWQNAAACSRRHLRPDGYGVYRRHGVSFGFFLELDRGTMNARDYLKKFGVYYRYRLSGRYERDYHGYPTILFVTADNRTEERIARVARCAAIGRPTKLPLLVTCRWRIDEPGNPYGLLGPIWREPDAGFDNRRPWLPNRLHRQTV